MVKLYYSRTDGIKEDAVYDRLFERLSPYKQKRCRDITSLKVRVSTMAAEILLKYALAKEGYTKEPEYVFGPYGKPYLKDKAWYFNVSHSKDLVLVSLGDVEMGCDIEEISTLKRDIANRFFHPMEQDKFSSPGDFFEIWTMKESYIKMTGNGLSERLSDFNVFEMNGRDCFFSTWDIDRYKCALCTPKKEILANPQYTDILSLPE